MVEQIVVLIHFSITIFYNLDAVELSEHDANSLILTFPISSSMEYYRWICNIEVLKCPTFYIRFQEVWKIFRQSSDFNNFQWWFDLKTCFTLLLQDEQRRLVKQIHSELKILQDPYRILAIDPSNDDLAEMIKIRSSIHKLFVEKSTANNHGYRERNVQDLGEIARLSLSSTQANLSLIHFLNHPLKGRVEEVGEMLNVAINF